MFLIRGIYQKVNKFVRTNPSDDNKIDEDHQLNASDLNYLTSPSNLILRSDWNGDNLQELWETYFDSISNANTPYQAENSITYQSFASKFYSAYCDDSKCFQSCINGQVAGHPIDFITHIALTLSTCVRVESSDKQACQFNIDFGVKLEKDLFLYSLKCLSLIPFWSNNCISLRLKLGQNFAVLFVLIFQLLINSIESTLNNIISVGSSVSDSSDEMESFSYFCQCCYYSISFLSHSASNTAFSFDEILPSQPWIDSNYQEFDQMYSCNANSQEYDTEYVKSSVSLVNKYSGWTKTLLGSNCVQKLTATSISIDSLIDKSLKCGMIVVYRKLIMLQTEVLYAVARFLEFQPSNCIQEFLGSQGKLLLHSVFTLISNNFNSSNKLLSSLICRMMFLCLSIYKSLRMSNCWNVLLLPNVNTLSNTLNWLRSVVDKSALVTDVEILLESVEIICSSPSTTSLDYNLVDIWPWPQSQFSYSEKNHLFNQDFSDYRLNALKISNSRSGEVGFWYRKTSAARVWQYLFDSLFDLIFGDEMYMKLLTESDKSSSFEIISHVYSAIVTSVDTNFYDLSKSADTLSLHITIPYFQFQLILFITRCLRRESEISSQVAMDTGLLRAIISKNFLYFESIADYNVLFQCVNISSLDNNLGDCIVTSLSKATSFDGILTTIGLTLNDSFFVFLFEFFSYPNNLLNFDGSINPILTSLISIINQTANEFNQNENLPDYIVVQLCRWFHGLLMSYSKQLDFNALPKTVLLFCCDVCYRYLEDFGIIKVDPNYYLNYTDGFKFNTIQSLRPFHWAALSSAASLLQFLTVNEYAVYSILIMQSNYLNNDNSRDINFQTNSIDKHGDDRVNISINTQPLERDDLIPLLLLDSRLKACGMNILCNLIRSSCTLAFSEDFNDEEGTVIDTAASPIMISASSFDLSSTNGFTTGTSFSSTKLSPSKLFLSQPASNFKDILKFIEQSLQNIFFIISSSSKYPDEFDRIETVHFILYSLTLLLRNSTYKSIRKNIQDMIVKNDFLPNYLHCLIQSVRGIDNTKNQSNLLYIKILHQSLSLLTALMAGNQRIRQLVGLIITLSGQSKDNTINTSPTNMSVQVSQASSHPSNVSSDKDMSTQSATKKQLSTGRKLGKFVIHENLRYFIRLVDPSPSLETIIVIFEMLLEVPIFKDQSEYSNNHDSILTAGLFCDDGDKPKIQNLYIISLLTYLLPFCQITVQSFILKSFYNLITGRASLANLSICCQSFPGLIDSALDLFPLLEDNVQDDNIKLILALGQYNISISQMKHLFYMFQNTREPKFRPGYAANLIMALKGMFKQFEGPRHSFVFDGRSSGLALPAVSYWPARRGLTFSTWLLIETPKLDKTQQYTPCILSLRNQVTGVGLEINLCKNSFVVTDDTATELERFYFVISYFKEDGSVIFYDKPTLLSVTENCWHFVAISLAFNGKGDILICIDNQYIRDKYLIPELPNNIQEPIIGDTPESLREPDVISTFRGQMGAIYIFSDGLNETFLKCIRSLGPDYFYCFESFSSPSIVDSSNTKRRNTVEYSHLFDGTLSSLVLLAYNPAVWLDDYFLDNTPLQNGIKWKISSEISDTLIPSNLALRSGSISLSKSFSLSTSKPLSKYQSMSFSNASLNDNSTITNSSNVSNYNGGLSARRLGGTDRSLRQDTRKALDALGGIAVTLPFLQQIDLPTIRVQRNNISNQGIENCDIGKSTASSIDFSASSLSSTTSNMKNAEEVTATNVDSSIFSSVFGLMTTILNNTIENKLMLRQLYGFEVIASFLEKVSPQHFNDTALEMFLQLHSHMSWDLYSQGSLLECILCNFRLWIHSNPSDNLVQVLIDWLISFSKSSQVNKVQLRKALSVERFFNDLYLVFDYDNSFHIDYSDQRLFNYLTSSKHVIDAEVKTLKSYLASNAHDIVEKLEPLLSQHYVNTISRNRINYQIALSSEYSSIGIKQLNEVSSVNMHDDQINQTQAEANNVLSKNQVELANVRRKLFDLLFELITHDEVILPEDIIELVKYISVVSSVPAKVDSLKFLVKLLSQEDSRPGLQVYTLLGLATDQTIKSIMFHSNHPDTTVRLYCVYIVCIVINLSATYKILTSIPKASKYHESNFVEDSRPSNSLRPLSLQSRMTLSPPSKAESNQIANSDYSKNEDKPNSRQRAWTMFFEIEEEVSESSSVDSEKENQNLAFSQTLDGLDMKPCDLVNIVKSVLKVSCSIAIENDELQALNRTTQLYIIVYNLLLILYGKSMKSIAVVLDNYSSNHLPTISCESTHHNFLSDICIKINELSSTDYKVCNPYMILNILYILRYPSVDIALIMMVLKHLRNIIIGCLYNCEQILRLKDWETYFFQILYSLENHSNGISKVEEAKLLCMSIFTSIHKVSLYIGRPMNDEADIVRVDGFQSEDYTLPVFIGKLLNNQRSIGMLGICNIYKKFRNLKKDSETDIWSHSSVESRYRVFYRYYWKLMLNCIRSLFIMHQTLHDNVVFPEDDIKLVDLGNDQSLREKYGVIFYFNMCVYVSLLFDMVNDMKTEALQINADSTRVILDIVNILISIVNASDMTLEDMKNNDELNFSFKIPDWVLNISCDFDNSRSQRSNNFIASFEKLKVPSHYNRVFFNAKNSNSCCESRGLYWHILRIIRSLIDCNIVTDSSIESLIADYSKHNNVGITSNLRHVNNIVSDSDALNTDGSTIEMNVVDITQQSRKRIIAFLRQLLLYISKITERNYLESENLCLIATLVTSITTSYSKMYAMLQSNYESTVLINNSTLVFNILSHHIESCGILQFLGELMFEYRQAWGALLYISYQDINYTSQQNQFRNSIASKTNCITDDADRDIVMDVLSTLVQSISTTDSCLQYSPTLPLASANSSSVESSNNPITSAQDIILKFKSLPQLDNSPSKFKSCFILFILTVSDLDILKDLRAVTYLPDDQLNDVLIEICNELWSKTLNCIEVLSNSLPTLISNTYTESKDNSIDGNIVVNYLDDMDDDYEFPLIKLDLNSHSSEGDLNGISEVNINNDYAIKSVNHWKRQFADIYDATIDAYLQQLKEYFRKYINRRRSINVIKTAVLDELQNERGPWGSLRNLDTNKKECFWRLDLARTNQHMFPKLCRNTLGNNHLTASQRTRGIMNDPSRRNSKSFSISRSDDDEQESSAESSLQQSILKNIFKFKSSPNSMTRTAYELDDEVADSPLQDLPLLTKVNSLNEDTISKIALNNQSTNTANISVPSSSTSTGIRYLGTGGLLNRNTKDQLLFRCPVEIISLSTCSSGSRSAGTLILTKKLLIYNRLNEYEDFDFKNKTNNKEFLWACKNFPTSSWKLSDVVVITKCRYQLRPVGVEIFLNTRKSVLFNFFDIKPSFQFYKLINNKLRCPNLISSYSYFSLNSSAEISSGNFNSILPTPTEDVNGNNINLNNQSSTRGDTNSKISLISSKANILSELWLKRELSNFDYLMQLNLLAGRTFNDLGQYPVFPWVIADYTSNKLDLKNPKSFRDFSLPMAAQKESQRRLLNEKYNNLLIFDDCPPYHNGSHYSVSGFVLWYLIRVEPFTSLHVWLQDGKFDRPDRIFHSVEAAYRGCTTNIMDVKELIPEFFYNPSFLENTNRIDFGTTQAGVKVDNVVLPPWAKNSHDFIRINREALECDYVSQHLHEWIDLVFGYKQRPPHLQNGDQAAVDSYNCFMHWTYADAVNLEELKQTDTELYETALKQIDNFGQTPAKLFNKPHPKRFAFDALNIIWPIASCIEGIHTMWMQQSDIINGYGGLNSSGDVMGSAESNAQNTSHSNDNKITANTNKKSSDSNLKNGTITVKSSNDLISSNADVSTISMTLQDSQIENRPVSDDKSGIRLDNNNPNSMNPNSRSKNSNDSIRQTNSQDKTQQFYSVIEKPLRMVTHDTIKISMSPVLFILELPLCDKLLTIDSSRFIGFHHFKVLAPDLLLPYSLKLDPLTSKQTNSSQLSSPTGSAPNTSGSRGTLFKFSVRERRIGVPFASQALLATRNILTTGPSSSYSSKYFYHMIGTSLNKISLLKSEFERIKRRNLEKQRSNRLSRRISDNTTVPITVNDSRYAVNINSPAFTPAIATTISKSEPRVSSSTALPDTVPPATNGNEDVRSQIVQTDISDVVAESKLQVARLPSEPVSPTPTRTSNLALSTVPTQHAFQRIDEHLSSHLFSVLPAHKLLFSCGHFDYSFKVTALETGKLIQSVSYHRDIVTCIAAVSDFNCHWLVTGSRDCTVMIWDLSLDSLASGFSSFNSTVAGSNVGITGVVVLIPPKHVLYGHDDVVTCLAVSPELDLVCSGSDDGTVIMSSLREGTYLRSIILGVYPTVSLQSKSPNAPQNDNESTSSQLKSVAAADVTGNETSLTSDLQAYADSSAINTSTTSTNLNEGSVTQKTSVTKDRSPSITIGQDSSSKGVKSVSLPNFSKRSVHMLVLTKSLCLVAYSHDGNVLCSYSINGRLLRMIECGERLYCIQPSEDGKVILTGGERCLLVMRWTVTLGLANDGPRLDLESVLDGVNTIKSISSGQIKETGKYFTSPIRSIRLTSSERLLLIGFESGEIRILSQDSEYLKRRLHRKLINVGILPGSNDSDQAN